MLKKVLVRIGVPVLALLLFAGVLYLFGGMQPPSAAARTVYAVEVAAGRQPAVEARFTIPIPGCVCHTDDPVLQVQHWVRRMSECGGCHSRG